MNKHTSVWIVGILSVVLLSSPLSAQSGGSHKPSCEPETIMENEEVRVWFQGLKGHIKVFDEARNDSSGGIYTYKTQRIVELAGDEVRAEMDLSRAFPHSSFCTVSVTETATSLAFAVRTDVVDDAGQKVGAPTVTFLYRLDHESSEAKFDLYVNDWPWASEESELAFDFKLHSTYDMEPATNGVGFRDQDGNPEGYMEWAETAHVVYEDEREDESIVASEHTQGPNELLVRLRYTDVEPGYADLEYDPWIGTGDYDIVAGRLVPQDVLRRAVPGPILPLYDDTIAPML